MRIGCREMLALSWMYSLGYETFYTTDVERWAWVSPKKAREIINKWISMGLAELVKGGEDPMYRFNIDRVREFLDRNRIPRLLDEDRELLKLVKHGNIVRYTLIADITRIECREQMSKTIDAANDEPRKI